MAPAAGSPEAGKIRAVSGNLGLAHLRLKFGLAAAAGELDLVAGGTRVVPNRPAWWPSEWGKKESEA